MTDDVRAAATSAEPENPDFAPVDSEAFDVACDVVERLTKHYPSPEWGRGKNGQVTLDWPSINLTVEVFSRGTVHYAWTESDDAGVSGAGYWETATANIGGILSRCASPAPQVAALREELAQAEVVAERAQLGERTLEIEVASLSAALEEARADAKWVTTAIRTAIHCIKTKNLANAGEFLDNAIARLAALPSGDATR